MQVEMSSCFTKGQRSAVLGAEGCVPHFYLSVGVGKGRFNCSHSRFTVNCVR